MPAMIHTSALQNFSKYNPVTSYLNGKFQNWYIPDQNIATNESFDTMEREAFIHTIHSV
jgi:hypothetical protein